MTDLVVAPRSVPPENASELDVDLRSRAAAMLALAREGDARAVTEATEAARELAEEAWTDAEYPFVLSNLVQTGLELLAARAPESAREVAMLVLSIEADRMQGRPTLDWSRQVFGELAALTRAMPAVALADIALLAVDTQASRAARPSGSTSFGGFAGRLQSSPFTASLCERHAGATSALPVRDRPWYRGHAKEFSATAFVLVSFLKIAQLAYVSGGCECRPEPARRSFDDLVAEGRAAQRANDDADRAREGEVETLLVARLTSDGGVGCAPSMDVCLTGETRSCFTATTAHCEAAVALVTAIRMNVDCEAASAQLAAFENVDAGAATDASRRFDDFVRSEYRTFCGAATHGP